MRRSRKLAHSLAFLFLYLLAGSAHALERNVSGMWWNPERDGEGIVVDLLDDTTAFIYWFTYDNQGNQLWLVGAGEIVGNRIEVSEMLRPSGGVFGAGFDPDQVSFNTWGSVTMTFPACQQATVEYDGPGGFGSGSIEMERLTPVAGASCQGPAAVPGLAGGITGNWFDPTHDGEGFLIQLFGDGNAIIVWFTYDKQGNPAWFVAVGKVVNGRYITVAGPDSEYTRGARFGGAFDTADVQRTPWGTMTFEFTSCDSGIVRYSGPSPFGGGQQLIQRLYTTRDVSCRDGGARAPNPVSLKTADQDARADSDTLTPGDGLELSATAADGTQIRLSVPAGAVPQDIEVTLTPATLDADGSGSLAGADNVVAMIEPHGLHLLESATLAFSNLPAGLGNADTFGFLDRGDDVHGLPFAVSGGSVEVPINHFSGVTVIDLGTMTLDPEPATAGNRAKDELNGLFENDNFNAGPVGEIYQDWFDSDVRPALEAAEADSVLIDRALEKFNEWRNSLRDLDLVGDFGLFDGRFADEVEFARNSLARAIRNGVEAGLDECVDKNNPAIAGGLMRWNSVADGLNLFGRQGLTRAFVENAVRDCARFRLVVDVEIDSVTPNGSVRSVARAEVQVLPDEDLFNHEGDGEFDYINLSVNFSASGLGCINNDMPVEDGIFNVLSSPVFDIFLGYPEQGAPRVRHVFSRMEEDWVAGCPLPGPPSQHPFREFIHLTSGFVSGLGLSEEVSSPAGSGAPPPVHEGDGFIAALDENFSFETFREFTMVENVIDETAELTVFAHYQLFHDPRR